MAVGTGHSMPLRSMQQQEGLDVALSGTQIAPALALLREWLSLTVKGGKINYGGNKFTYSLNILNCRWCSNISIIPHPR
jgi:hypothetical protein